MSRMFLFSRPRLPLRGAIMNKIVLIFSDGTKVARSQYGEVGVHAAKNTYDSLTDEGAMAMGSAREDFRPLVSDINSDSCFYLLVISGLRVKT